MAERYVGDDIYERGRQVARDLLEISDDAEQALKLALLATAYLAKAWDAEPDSVLEWLRILITQSYRKSRTDGGGDC